MRRALLSLVALALSAFTIGHVAVRVGAQTASSCGKPTSAECWRPAPDSVLVGNATDGGTIGADVARLELVERCAIGGDLNAAACVALDRGGAGQTPGRLESAVSAPVTYRRPVIKWDIAAPSLEELARYGWYLHVDGVRQDLAGVRCGPASGQTPAGQFSCEIEVLDVAAGVHALAIQAWITAPAPVSATSLRVVIQ